MPTKPRVKKAKAYKKKSYKKSYKKSTIQRSMVSVGLGFPKKLQTTLKYVETVPLVSTAGSFATYSFSANTIVDPNATSSGHQPNYADQYFLLYNKFLVIGSKAKITFLPANGTTGCVAVGVLLNDDLVTTPTSFSGLFEQTQSSHKYINFNSAKPTTMTSKFSAKKMFGGVGILNNTQLVGTTGNIGTGSDPPEEAYYTICCQSADGVSTNTLVVAVEITYIVIYFELKDVNQS